MTRHKSVPSFLWPLPPAPQVFDSLGSTGAEVAEAVAAAAEEAPAAEAEDADAPAAAEAEALELGVIPSTFQAESCLTLEPPHPSWENSASRTELSCSKCLEVDPLEAVTEEVVLV